MKINTFSNNITGLATDNTLVASNNHGSEWRSRGLPRLAICTSLSLGLGFVSTVEADCTLFHPDHCVKEGASTVGKTVDKNFIKPVEGFGQNVGNFTTQQVKNGGELAKKGYEESKKAVVGFVKGPLVNEAEAHWKEVEGKMVGIGNAFKSVSNTSDFQQLALAVARQDSAGIARTLPRVLYPVFVQTDKDKTWSEFDKMIKAGKVGTLLLSWSGGLSLGLGVDVDAGIAIDIAYVTFARQQYTLAPNNPFTSMPFQGSIGTVFTAAGGSIGLSAGGSSNFVFGYHAAPPSGVGGPGFCLGLQVKAGGGTGVDVCWDISGLPWKIVTAGIAFGVGAEVDVSGGANYTAVLAKVCSNGSFGGMNVTCPGEGTTPTTTAAVTTVTPTLANALDCVSNYAKANTCDWNHWTEMYKACKTWTVPELNDNDFLLNEVKAGRCTWNNWTNLYKQAIGDTTATAGGTPYIAARGNSNKCMAKKEMDTNNGNIIHLWDCAGGIQDNKKWTYEPATGYIRLVAQPSKCLAKQGWPNQWENGRIAHLWDCSHPAQNNLKWNYDQSTGYIRAQANSNKCLHKQSGGWNNGNRIHIWDCNAGPAENKTWTISTSL